MHNNHRVLIIVLIIVLVFSGCSSIKNEDVSSDGNANVTSRYIVDKDTGKVIDIETGEEFDGAVIDESTGNIIDSKTGEIIVPNEKLSPSNDNNNNSVVDVSVEYNSDDETSSVTDDYKNQIALKGGTISFKGEGISVNNNTATILSAGTYSISGKLNDGQIVIDAPKEANVILVLNNAEIHCSFSAPIFIKSSNKTVISLAEGTVNTVTDGKSYNTDDLGEPNAAIFCKDDLTINGTGALSVNANYNNGIGSNDELKITGGKITVNSKNNGIKGKDCVAVKNADITINAKSDGIQSDNNKDPDKGFVLIEGNRININAVDDGIQAQNNLAIKGGNIKIVSGGGSAKGKTDQSAKGLKSEGSITIENATMNIDSADDPIHCDSVIQISSGDLTLSTDSDAIHADSSILISGGNIDILKSYEGIEALNITIKGGNINIQSDDNGINVPRGDDKNSSNGTKPIKKEFVLSGGYIYINSKDDGVDVKGSIFMTGGTLIINSPAAGDLQAIEYGETCKISGGLLVAAGSLIKAQYPDISSTQNTIVAAFPHDLKVGTPIHIASGNNEEIVTITSAKDTRLIIVSSPKIKNGKTYEIFYGGSVKGENTDGIYNGGYSQGSRLGQFTILDRITKYGF